MDSKSGLGNQGGVRVAWVGEVGLISTTLPPYRTAREENRLSTHLNFATGGAIWSTLQLDNLPPN